jgi:hypothetical protein
MSRFSHLRRWVGAACVVSVAAIPAVALDAPAAGAALRPVTGCGFHLGSTITESGAAGTEFLFLELVPASPAQDCTTSVPFTASITPVAVATTGPYTDIDMNPLHASETATFAPGRRHPTLSVGWTLHCADPVVPGTFTVATASGSASLPIEDQSCGPAGAPHSFLGAADIQFESVVGIAPTSTGEGYHTVDNGGLVRGAGHVTPFFDTPRTRAAVVGIAATHTGEGDWTVASDGGVFTYGNASFHGSTGNLRLNQPMVGMAATSDDGGYWLVARDGGVFSFGDARFHGSTGAMHLNAPIVAIIPTYDDGGYWLVARDGGVFSFGDARFFGGLGSVLLNAPIVGAAVTPTGAGYWMVASDGGVFSFGDAHFEGSAGALPLAQPISAMAATSSGRGYWIVGADGGIFAYGDAPFLGSTPS